MDPKERDLNDRLARLNTEYETLSAEMKKLLPPTSGRPPTGEALAKQGWIESRLREIELRKRQIAERLG